MRAAHPARCDDRRVKLGIALLVVMLSFAAAGCGDSGGNSEAEQWASSVCSTVSDWQGEIEQSAQDVQAALQSPGAGTVATIESQIQSALTATEKLSTDLKAIGAPDIDSGTQAKQQVDALASQLTAAVNVAKNSVDALPDNPNLGDLAQKLAPLVPAIQTLADSTKNAVEAIQTSSGELKQGFEDADSCKSFR
jgi:septal ring factor EnvC (AmiA/AmiB activator)